MRKSRLSLRLPSELIAALDRIAQEEGRSRSNLVDRILTRAAGARPDRVETLQVDVAGSRVRLLSFRLDLNTLRRLDTLAGATDRARSELCARLLAGAVQPGWFTLAASASRRRSRSETPEEGAGVFA